jgi:ABC-type molybdate transport system permease subunit
MEPTGDITLGFLGTLAVIFGIIAAVMVLCLPFFVYRIRKEVISMDRTLRRIATVLAYQDEGLKTIGADKRPRSTAPQTASRAH